MGNRLAQQDAAAGLVDLAFGVGQVDVEVDQRRGEYAAADSQGRAGISGTVQIGFSLLQGRLDTPL